jgi:hypothetical protein
MKSGLDFCRTLGWSARPGDSVGTITSPAGTLAGRVVPVDTRAWPRRLPALVN